MFKPNIGSSFVLSCAQFMNLLARTAMQQVQIFGSNNVLLTLLISRISENTRIKTEWSQKFRIAHKRSYIPQRWVFAILNGLGICLGSVYEVILSITIVEMVSKQPSVQKVDDTCQDTNHNLIHQNETLVAFYNANDSSRIVYDWDEYTQGIILSSFYWTSSFSQIFCGVLSERFGGKYLFGSAIFIPAVIIFFTPFIIEWGGSVALIASRALTGIPNSAMFPASSTLIPKWSTQAERTTIGNIVYSGQLLGVFIGTVSPALIIKYSGMGWPIAYYILGIIGMIWSIVWSVLVYEEPERHPFITEEELAYLQSSKSTESCTNKSSAPWNHILRSKEFWVFTINVAGSNWAFYALASDLPKYMSGVVKFSLESNGYFSSLPYLFMWAATFPTTWISDKVVEKQWMSLTNVRKLFITTSVTGPCIFMLLASYAECDKVLVVTMFLIAITIMGSIYPSLLMNPLDLSPNYAGSLMALGNGLGTTTGFIVPYVIGVLTPNQSITEWRLVFWIVTIFSVVPNVMYLFLFNAEVQYWNDLSTKKTVKNTAEVDQAAC